MKYTVDLTQEQVDALIVLGSKLFCEDVQTEPEEEKWPQKGDMYYAISGNGEVNIYDFEGDMDDRGSMSIGNFFRTKEEAEFELERLKVIHELKQFADDVIEWDSQNVHYCIYYVKEDGGKLDIDYNVLDKHAEIYFATLKDAQKAIDKIGADRIKKFYLRVKE